MQAETPKQCQVYRLGLVPYTKAWELQERLAAQIAAQSWPPTLLLLQHPHIFTFGRRGNNSNLLWSQQECTRKGVEVLWVDRGGDVTYHGPGQLVGYPLLPLLPGGLNTQRSQNPAGNAPHPLPQADYVGYLRKLEECLIRTLARLGVPSGQLAGQTGVWVQPDVRSRCRNCPPENRQKTAKIAAIGVKVDARGVSSHGFALNIDPDMSYFAGIIGCGLVDQPVASLAEIIDPLPSFEAVEDQVIVAFSEIFDYQVVEGRPEEILVGEKSVE